MIGTCIFLIVVLALGCIMFSKNDWGNWKH